VSREDRTPEALEQPIVQLDRKTIYSSGLYDFTARAPAKVIGDASSTICDFCRDMDAAIIEIDRSMPKHLKHGCPHDRMPFVGLFARRRNSGIGRTARSSES
jgi:hypothetical protein